MLFWSGDLPAIEKLLYLTGVNSYNGCRFCTIRGTYCNYAGHVYFPHKETDPEKYPLRSHDDMFRKVEKVLERGITDNERSRRSKESGMLITRSQSYTGTDLLELGHSAISQIFYLRALEFPWCFPLDIMHLLFENVGRYLYSFQFSLLTLDIDILLDLHRPLTAQLMFDHWSGNFKYAAVDGKRWAGPFVLNKATWEKVGMEMDALAQFIPADFGRPPRSIFRHHRGFKAEEWLHWVTLFSLPLLEGRLHDE
jgi:hypothetical protein